MYAILYGMSFLTRGRPRVFAHRGGAALGPENTLAAFDVGLATGADWLELDVHLSADGVPVVLHDATLDRTTDATGLVAARTADELAAIDAGYRFAQNGGFPFRGQGVGVPTLAAVLARYPGVPVIVELKGVQAALGVAVARAVEATDAVDRVCLAGESAVAVGAARRALPAAATSATRGEVRRAVYRTWVGLGVGARAFGSFQVPEAGGLTRIVSPRFVREAHRAGLLVEVWTVDRASQMRRLLEWGVDALITNRPDEAVLARDAISEGGAPPR
jgi:glycerophosphoryl diester phosphodiesterase